jgi:hypothetical protein
MGQKQDKPSSNLKNQAPYSEANFDQRPECLPTNLKANCRGERSRGATEELAPGQPRTNQVKICRKT